MLHIPILRHGEPYESIDQVFILHHATGQPVARVSQANAGLITRDIGRMRHDVLDAFSMRELLELCRKAAKLFMTATLPVGAGEAGEGQSFENYIGQLSATTGMPVSYCRGNAKKIHRVLDEMEAVVAGLTRGFDLSILDRGYGDDDGRMLSWFREARIFGAVLPSNSPGVHSLWAPAVALKTPIALKPGREEPWTPLRMIQAFIAAGFPKEAFGFYPTDHGGAGALLAAVDRAMLFGDASTTRAWAKDSRVELHGPGYSKVVLGADAAARWEQHVDLMVSSIAANGGRSCINASAVWTPANGRAIAEALAQRLAKVVALPAEHPEAQIAAFANPQVAQRINGSIDEALRVPGAEDLTAKYRAGGGERLVQQGQGGCAWLLPTIIWCAERKHPLANREFLFPFASVVECPAEEIPHAIGPSLVVTAITDDEKLRRALMASPNVDRLNLGPVPTWQLSWDQPHEGNLFQHLYRQRAFQLEAAAGGGAVSEMLNIPGLAVPALFRRGALAQLGERAGALGASRVLLVSDPGLAAAGHVDRAAASLRAAGVAVRVFDEAEENPTTVCVDKAVAAAREHRADLLVGLGGGSSMDCAKGCNFILTNGGRMQDYWGVGKATKKMLPLIAVPTTAGTGSEAQSFALITDEKTHQKMACGDEKALPALAILDADLTATQPQKVAAATAIDAVAHAVETAGCAKRSDVSQPLSRQAWELLNAAIERALGHPDDAESRERMLLGAHLAGAAIENSMLGAAHACANPLTAKFGVPHGAAVGLMLPHVIRFNAAGPDGNPYRLLDVDSERLAHRIEAMLEIAALPRSLTEYAVGPAAIDELAAQATQQWTARFNPRPVNEANFRAIYESAL